MESWNFASEGKTLFFSDEPDWADALPNPRPAARTAAALIPDESSSSLGGLGLSEILCCNNNNNNGGLISPNSSESVSRASNNSQESSLIALKLGRLAPDGRGSREATATQVSSSSSAKRARTRGCYSQTTAFCQVLGCNMDLSASKDYHKKHKVCDVHSKTPKVIVNGVEQRFCQQCSRFHMLSEFDDGKRSCRRRLAGHNERRRKPQFDGLSEKTHKFSHSYQGIRYLGTSLQKRTPFVFSDILPGVILSPEKHEQVNQFGHMKFEDEPIYGTHQLATPVMNAHLPSKSFNGHGVEKQQRTPEIPPQTEDYFFHSAATIHKSLGVSNSPCALSLLSAQSQNLSSHSAGIPASSPLILQGAHQTLPQLLGKHPRARPMERHGPNGFYSCGMNPVGMDQLEPMVFPATHTAADFEVVSDRAFEGSNYSHAKYCLAPEHGPTVDLLQLSSHLQRVEHQRNFMQVKQENEDFCCFPTA